MNEKLNLVEILNNAPKGIRLWSPICGVCELYTVNVDFGAFPIVCIGIDDGLEWHFKANGAFTNNTGVECLLFPSRENRDWSTFNIPINVPNEHKQFEPFQKVLIRTWTEGGYIWVAAEYSNYDEIHNKHYLTSGLIVKEEDIIQYEGNEDRLGKTAEYLS